MLLGCLRRCAGKGRGFGLAMILAVMTVASLNAGTITVTVRAPNGALVTGGFRYVVEEDLTYRPVAGAADPDQHSLNWDRSHMPVVTKGETTGSSVVIDVAAGAPGARFIDSNKYYYVSVLPKAAGEYSNGGASVKTNGAGVAAVTVTLTPQPVPTAQITVFAFHDNAPLNNEPDLPEEPGLGGFTVKVEDAGGTYGAAAGELFTDVFGNPLGTTYQTDASGKVVLVDGSPVKTGWAPLVTKPDGTLVIKYLFPAKYGVSVVPPSGQGWQQTTTIEGTKINDAWVKANEPPFFQEFGPPGPHVFFGFTKQLNNTLVLTGGATISGRITNLHMSAPPDAAFYSGAPFGHTTPWVGLNTNAGLNGSSTAVFVKPVNEDGTFSIPNVPPGDWQLVVFDNNLDLIFGSHAVSVTGAGPYLCNGATCSLGDVPVFQWFTRQEHYVFWDFNENGKYEPELQEFGIPDQTINLRFRDGSINQTNVTDFDGYYGFDEVFPFFSWFVAEVDFAKYKATGATIVVDAGGAIPAPPATLPDWTFGGQLNPQLQPDNGNQPFRVETSTDASGKYNPVLLEAFQGFIGQTNVFAWGKNAYQPGQNGGITGVVYYGVTRAEDDPRMAAAEPFEPAIPNVTVNLWTLNSPTIPSDPDPAKLVKSNMRLVASTKTDSWDDNQPEGCVWDGNAGFTYGGASFPTIRSCFDGLRVFNQTRPGVFDGGYAFFECYVDQVTTSPTYGKCVAEGTTGAVKGPLPPDAYVVEVVPPVDGNGHPVYEIQREQSKNVDFGNVIVPAIPPPACANWNDTDHLGYLVPAELELFPGVTSAYAGQKRPLCDRKIVALNDMQNTAADFFLYTETPIAAHAVGFILDDTTNEFDPNSPQFGEKYAPPWVPVSFHEYTGREINRVLSDQFGRFSALVPGTFTKNVPSPSGVAPNMLVSCMNSKLRANGTPDPNHDPKYSQFCYTLQYVSGKTTYLDTPVVPTGAFAGGDQFPVDCELPDQTPRIANVSTPLANGPWAPTGSGNAANRVVTINSVGTIQVPNPDYCPGPPITTDGACPVVNTAQTISRDFGFGLQPGTVSFGGVPLAVSIWNDSTIVATMPDSGTVGELVITRSADDGGRSTVNGVTMTVGPGNSSSIRMVPSASYPTIQSAIDAANPGELVLVAPGVYNETVIMYKPVKLQGSGEATKINAVKTSSQALQAWRNKINSLLNSGAIELLPGQEAGAAELGIEPLTFFSEEGAGVLVTGRSRGNAQFNSTRAARVDGFSISGADNGGGIAVSGYADFLTISNNVVTNNTGDFGGGIRVGHPTLVTQDNQGVDVYVDADNDNVKIRHNQIIANGGIDGAGGGVSICTGSDNYEVVQNWICGNFTLADGAGIGHLGRSNNGLIEGNWVLFNENFNQSVVVSGGGIFVGGQPPLAGQTLSPGSGSVKINANWIQGNSAGVGDGGGIKTANVNGLDLQGNLNSRFRVNILNNMIVNNVAALAGGGIALQDTVYPNIIHNTVAHNDSTATSSLAFRAGSPTESSSQPAGIVSRAHTAAVVTAANNAGVTPLNSRRFSNPDLRNNIVWENRSFYFTANMSVDPPVFQLLPDIPGGDDPVFSDLAVLGTGNPLDKLNPQYSVLTSIVGYLGSGNSSTDPQFVAPYFNGGRGTTFTGPGATTGIQVPAAFDEGGNFIRVRFGPLEPGGNYHLQNASLILGDGTSAALSVNTSLSSDIEGTPRPSPSNTQPDPGADENPN